MKKIHINEARVTLAVASQMPEFFGLELELPEELANAILKEQSRKHELSAYLEKLRECVRAGSDWRMIQAPRFLDYTEVPPNAEESKTQPKPKRGRPPRVPQ